MGSTADCSRIPEKEILFYTIEASMSMTIHEAFCTIRENELPQSHPNDTKFAKKCCLFALFARWVQSMKTIPLVHLLVGGRLAVPDEPGRASPTPTRFQTGLLSLALAIIALTTCHQAMAESQTVWQIGKFDRSSAEFNQKWEEMALHGAALAETPVVYTVAKSDAQSDWYAYQPGSGNERAGRRPHPYTIKFFSAASPRGCYFLKVGFVIGQRAYFPTLQVEINGQQGWAYHHPQRHDAPGDKYWSDEVDIQLPTPSLKQGENTLVLTAIDESGSDANAAGLEYDALELDQDTGQAYDPRKLGVQFEPSIYYQAKGKQLLELVDAYLRHNSPLRDARFDLQLSGRNFLLLSLPNGVLARSAFSSPCRSSRPTRKRRSQLRLGSIRSACR